MRILVRNMKLTRQKASLNVTWSISHLLANVMDAVPAMNEWMMFVVCYDVWVSCLSTYTQAIEKFVSSCLSVHEKQYFTFCPSRLDA